MAIGILLILGLIVGAVVVQAVMRAQRPTQPVHHSPQTAGPRIRRFFQYLLLAGLLFAALGGVSGLVGRAVDPTESFDGGPDLALMLTFTVVALPLWLALAWWTLRQQRRDPEEATTAGWSWYLTAVGLVTLAVGAVGWYQALSVLVSRTQAFDGSALAIPVVWSTAWALHHIYGPRRTPADLLRPLHLIGSLGGLITATVGLILVLSATLRELLGLTLPTLVPRTVPLILDGAIVLGIGVVIWSLYWLARVATSERDTGWHALVLLFGVGGGLLAAVIAGSLALYGVLVLLVGEPTQTDPAVHLHPLPTQLGTVIAGLLVWWYHRTLLAGRPKGLRERTEVNRVYRYLLAAVGLIAASAGLVMVMVTIVEAVAGGADLLVGPSAINALLGCLVLLAVGVPVWWWHWRHAQHARRLDPTGEVASPTRRAYLLLLFGLAFVAAVIALMTLVYQILQSVLDGGVDAETMRRIRFPLGILVTTSLLSAYHWTVFREDRATAETLEAEQAAVADEAEAAGSARRENSPRRVVLVADAAQADPRVAALRADPHLRLQLVSRNDGAATPWTEEAVRSAFAQYPTHDLVVLAEADGLRVIPVQLD
ncbi:DUF5671 domain-containing protein [Ornithinimicrobium sp. Y1694]|uniref:DUF5671 domain-containing protein n=1 Tax=Ornithinimicrobium sp. Y1694 TaxID=3418590 RepID=UPI003CF463C3